MKRLILAAVLLAGTAMTTLPAQAEFILNDQVFADLGATGFGNAPRLLTLQNPFENGAVVSNGEATQFLSQLHYRPQSRFVVSGTTCASNTCTTGLRREPMSQLSLMSRTCGQAALKSALA
jgi:hypothetical protein